MSLYQISRSSNHQIIKSSNSILSFTPSRDLVLVQLPPYTDKLMRDHGALSISTLNAIKYHPTHGTIIAISPDLSPAGGGGTASVTGEETANCQLRTGDTVFFEKSLFSAAKEAAFEPEAEFDKGVYFEQGVYALHQAGTFYMLIPYYHLYLVKNSIGSLSFDGSKEKVVDKITMLNNYVLCEPVENESPGAAVLPSGELEGSAANCNVASVPIVPPTLQIADLREETYALNQVKILSSPTSLLSPGDIAFTLPHCDIPLVEPVNQQSSVVCGPSSQFIIELINIIAKYNPMLKTYTAAPGRIILENIQLEEETTLSIDSDFAKQYGKVHSAGEGVNLHPGDIIVYPFTAGKKNKLPILPNSNTQYEVISKDDYFCTVQEQKEFTATDFKELP